MNSLTRTQLRATAMRQTLIGTAEQLLAEGGVGAVTAEEVARRADVSVQTVYNRVGGQPALLLAIAERALEQTREFLDAAYAAGGSPRERIRRAADAYVRLALEHPKSFMIFANPPQAPGAIERVAELTLQQHAKLAEVIRAGLDSQELKPGLNPDAAASALWAMMNGMLTLALRDDAMRPASVSPDELVEAALAILEFGLGVR